MTGYFEEFIKMALILMIIWFVIFGQISGFFIVVKNIKITVLIMLNFATIFFFLQYLSKLHIWNLFQQYNNLFSTFPHSSCQNNLAFQHSCTAMPKEKEKDHFISVIYFNSYLIYINPVTMTLYANLSSVWNKNHNLIHTHTLHFNVWIISLPL